VRRRHSWTGAQPCTGYVRRWKLLYRPVALIAGILAGLAAGTIFKRVWKLLAREEETPNAKDKFRSWPEVISAAAVQGAVFGAVKAAVDRGAATGFERLTGVWPGKTRPRRRRRG
jgi:hypothetical protein